MCHFLERGMGLNKIIDGQWDVELLAKVHNTINLMLAPSIGEQYEGDIMIMKVSEGFGSSRKTLRRT